MNFLLPIIMILGIFSKNINAADDFSTLGHESIKSNIQRYRFVSPGDDGFLLIHWDDENQKMVSRVYDTTGLTEVILKKIVLPTSPTYVTDEGKTLCINCESHNSVIENGFFVSKKDIKLQVQSDVEIINTVFSFPADQTLEITYNVVNQSPLERIEITAADGDTHDMQLLTFSILGKIDFSEPNIGNSFANKIFENNNALVFHGRGNITIFVDHALLAQ